MAKHTLKSCCMSTVRSLKYAWKFFSIILERGKASTQPDMVFKL